MIYIPMPGHLFTHTVYMNKLYNVNCCDCEMFVTEKCVSLVCNNKMNILVELSSKF